ncbi:MULTISPECIES: SDR family NAD(P)-dependent oxidoreductase [Variovorax]|jgi:NAD(P)-dependent dehydrogenase (short-subunit alcohol dehydrogenase family)|uniref:SDR family NAD(P)-dependent oxidoreductase n=1 Tax=Variovorax TaxID=34072 RepID=UPI00086B91E9|nr:MULTISPECIES: SDR family NAD(P)-dependent oxidoreductase [Variovorax]MBN8756345.1 SDR family oxidoreductase [Variovorax sp.]ODU14372.1 MAG: 3-hydroxyacyl-CoA dehydrogenase [Variovorax sp. SCN 67-85]ODV26424.1 MAG: 3-hydroxyacyl-CoA dehydrogenase [Variovorax sp. SCN 67-20]OJZ02384.1 MAG: 3-hydroxyacyl-CoA dehydrogenase [Variovorax sp. 67-131]UKI10343.1 SDR family oxidoreductase [Variovorax paradoxus]
MYSNSLTGRHALVTGAARGIGAEIARTLAAQGALLTLLGRDREALQRVADSLEGDGHGVVAADVANQEAVQAAFAEARAVRGPVAILVNNAGAAESAPFLKTSFDLWQRMLSVNLTGSFLCAQAALPDMLDAGWGRIVNIASTAGQKGYAYVAAYTAAKHGVVGLTRSLALEVARKGITVNAVCPGYTDTDILRNSVANVVGKTGRSEADALAEFSSVNPQRRIVQPAEVADTVRWLCGEGAASVTGQSISVSGGEVT